jgi:hypothetical protein
MIITLKENSKQMDIKGMVIKILLSSKAILFDYPFQSMKEGLWERDTKSLELMLHLCSNPYVSSCCKHDVYTNYISTIPEDEKLLEWLREGGKLGKKLLAKYDSFSICFKCRQWCGLLEDNFFTFSHESDTI